MFTMFHLGITIFVAVAIFLFLIVISIIDIISSNREIKENRKKKFLHKITLLSNDGKIIDYWEIIEGYYDRNVKKYDNSISFEINGGKILRNITGPMIWEKIELSETDCYKKGLK
jgi:hypothetical protein